MDIEKFIKENRDKFDGKEPSYQNWLRIVQKLEKSESEPRLVPLSMMYKVAASVVVILTIGALLGGYLVNQKYHHDLAAKNQELVELQRYYNGQFQSNLSKLASLDNANEVRMDLQQLDAIEKEILEEIKRNPNENNERYMHALIQNYESRIALMEKVLKKVKHYNEQSNSNEHIEI